MIYLFYKKYGWYNTAEIVNYVIKKMDREVVLC